MIWFRWHDEEDDGSANRESLVSELIVCTAFQDCFHFTSRGRLVTIYVRSGRGSSLSGNLCPSVSCVSSFCCNVLLSGWENPVAVNCTAVTCGVAVGHTTWMSASLRDLRTFISHLIHWIFLFCIAKQSNLRCNRLAGKSRLQSRDCRKMLS